MLGCLGRLLLASLPLGELTRLNSRLGELSIPSALVNTELTGQSVYPLDLRLNDQLCHSWLKGNHFVLLGAVVAGDDSTRWRSRTEVDRLMGNIRWDE